ncbi:MAG: hypothetical protein A2857_06705 [Candidatus Levybacteria bacterium RIFCSPHIGHO2_01_FULL_36_15]|nr:MAG: hypothetical protein A2857_06705 [Candidatus Levybacteria bacterium RIFCSPHIGHO2_01_FULL_36_15]OGH37788.1 MAG: hypothetical protein A2905_00030 [Candidatus Levybacteria bacterium RIFCSPLOWO2_01_FULL_36_10]
MKNKSKYTVTIGIPVYNEEANIDNLLISLLNQKCGNFVLREISIYSDGSTDKTHEKIETLIQKNPIIKLKKDRQRKGKYFRVNQIFRECKSDIIVVLDADIALVGNRFLEKLVGVLIADDNAKMVAAHQIPLRPDNFIGKVIHASFVLWDFVRLSIPNHNSALNFFGSATAYRGSFAQSVVIPTFLSDPHLFIYLMADKTNGFRYCRSAEILQWSIATLSDLEKLLRRTIGKKDEKLEKMFGDKIKKVYFIPWQYKLIGILKTFIRLPFYAPLALLLNLIMLKRAAFLKPDTSPIWDIVTSTKKPIKYEK